MSIYSRYLELSIWLFDLQKKCGDLAQSIEQLGCFLDRLRLLPLSIPAFCFFSVPVFTSILDFTTSLVFRYAVSHRFLLTIWSEKKGSGKVLLNGHSQIPAIFFTRWKVRCSTQGYSWYDIDTKWNASQLIWEWSAIRVCYNQNRDRVLHGRSDIKNRPRSLSRFRCGRIERIY